MSELEIQFLDVGRYRQQWRTRLPFEKAAIEDEVRKRVDVRSGALDWKYSHGADEWVMFVGDSPIGRFKVVGP